MRTWCPGDGRPKEAVSFRDLAVSAERADNGTGENAYRPGRRAGQAATDAVHIAAAAVEKCEYLLTWNFRHIANVKIRREVERILAKHGYSGTTICAPEELI
jgi:hypothetical protein